MPAKSANEQRLLAENAELRARLEEADEALRAIRSGEVDALVIEGASGPQIFALQGLDARSNRIRGEMLAQVSDAVIASDSHGRVTYLNAAAERQYGVAASAVLGENLSRVYESRWLHPEDEAAALTALRETGQWRGENLHTTHSGQLIHVESSITRLQGEDGTDSGQLAVIRDITERKRDENAAALLVAIVESCSDAVVGKDLRGNVTSWNHAAEKIFGYSAVEMVGQPISKLIPPERQAEEIEILQRIARGQSVPLFDTTRLRKDGSTIDVSLTVSPVRDAAGRIVGASKIARDITERRRAEERLRASDERVRLATDAAELGIWTWQPEGDLVIWENKWPYKLLGVPQTDEPVTAARFKADFLHPDDLAAFEQAFGDAVARGTQLLFECRIHRPDRVLRWIEFTGKPVLAPGGKCLRLLGTVRDITQHKESAATLQQNAGLFSTLIDKAPLGVYVIDAQLRLQQVNPLALPVFDNVRPLIGRDFSEVMQILWGSELAREIVAIFRHTLETGEHYNSPPFSKQRSDLGEERSYDWETQRVTLPDGQHGVVCYFTDVTERHRFEAALREAKDAAEAANQSKDRFLAVLSHELRTPLTPVLMAVGALEHDPDLRPDVREDLVMIKRNIELETKLIDDLLDLNRITSGKLPLHIEPIDLNEAVRQVCGICRPQLGERGIRLEIELDDDAGPVAADPARLQQVLWNVLKNAIKFTPEGGTIRVTTKRLDSGHREVCVRDSGMGIPDELLPRIFDAFEQGDASVTRQFGGLGLGLAICKALVELHRGAIRAESGGPGQGATFTVQLPGAASAAIVEFADTAPAQDGKSPQLRLLVVEDHADTARTLGRLLRGAGFAVVTASDVASATAAAERETFDLLVSDLGLPDGSGFDIMRAVRAKRSVPGIAMSGYGMDEDVRRSREAGFMEHLVKPIDVPRLIEAIWRMANDRG